MAAALDDKAQFYQKLDTGISAGLTLQQVLAAQLLPPGSEAAASKLQREIDRGTSVARAFTLAGLVTSWEAELIRIGEESGRLEAVLSRLNDFYTGRLKLLHHVRGKLVTPGLTLLVALTVLPLPAVAGGVISPLRYLVQTVIALLVLRLIYRKVLIGPLVTAAPAVANTLLYRVQGLVGNGHFLRQLFEIAYLDMLTMCLDSGLDAARALNLVQGVLPDKAFRKRHARVAGDILKNGTALGEALEKHGILRHREVLSFFRTCEAGGTLHSDLGLYVRRKQTELGATVDDWLRRLSVVIYIGVAAYAVLRILPLFMDLFPT